MAASGFAPTLAPGADLRPQPPGGLGLGALLALLVHGGLILALTLGVQWRTTEPEGVSAELWAAVPQVAAPPAPEPAPTPPQAQPAPPPPPPPVKAAEPPQPAEAQIAVEKARAERERKDAAEREKAEKDKAEKDKADRLKAEKAEKAEKAQADKLKAEKAAAEKLMQEQAQEQRLAKLREDNLRRMMGQAGGTGAPGATGNAARDAGPSAGYAGRIKARIKPNIVFVDDLPGNPVAEVEVRLAPDGTIVGRTLKKSSGVKEWDDAVLRAIDRTEALPKDVDGRVPASLIASFRPKD